MNSNTEAALSASIKYFLLSALATSFLLLGVCLLYAATGSTYYDHIIAVLFYLLPSTDSTFYSNSTNYTNQA